MSPCHPQPKFKSVECHVDSGLVVLKSVKDQKSDIVVHFALFRFPPFKFLAHFGVRRSVFGAAVTDAEISQDSLIVVTSYTGIRLYSLEYIIDKVSGNCCTYHHVVSACLLKSRPYSLSTPASATCPKGSSR